MAIGVVNNESSVALKVESTEGTYSSPSAGTEYIEAQRIQNALTSSQLKVKPKSANIAGLQLADLIAHPSRNEILKENGHVKTLAPFGAKIIAVLQEKYYQKDGRFFGKKFV